MGPYQTPENSRQAMKEAWKTGSPFQARKSDQRPKLRFSSPDQTEKWLSEREKTDYTYARSASYSSVVAASLKTLEELAISYITPILSRRALHPAMLPDKSPVPAGSTRRTGSRAPATGSTRRSARIASRGKGGFVSDRDAAPETYSRTRRMTTTTTTSYSAYNDSTYVHADDTPVSSLSNGTESSSKTYSETGARKRMFPGNLHEKYISHLYGLDGDEYDGECSDTESNLTAAYRSSNRSTNTSRSIWESHHCDDNTSTLSTISTLSKSAILYPFSVLYWVTTTVLTVVSMIMLAPFALARTVHKSASFGTSSMLHSMYSILSRCVQYLWVLLYRIFSSLLYWLVHFINKCREAILGVFGLGSLGYSSASSAMSYSTTALSSSTGSYGSGSTTLISASERLEGERRRKSCCLWLLLLLLLPLLLYLLSGTGGFLLAALSRNDTKVNQFDASTAFAASGCMKCLKKDYLMGMIGDVVNDRVGGLQSQIDSQNQKILLLHEEREAQAAHIETLTNQLAILLSNKDVPSKDSLDYINTLEAQITSLRGDFRNLQMAQTKQDKKDSDGGVIGIAALGLLRTDLDSMDGALAALKGDLKNLHGLFDQDRHLHGDVSIHISNRLAGLEDRVSSDVNGLEKRLTQLQQNLQGLTSEQGQDHSQLEFLSLQIGVVEGNMTATRNELRSLAGQLASVLGSVDKVKELEDKMALNADLQVLQVQVADLQSKHTDSINGLRGLENKHQTLQGSLNNIQTDMTQLEGHMEDMEQNKFSATKLSLEQLQERLGQLETGSQDVLSSMQQLQDGSSGKVDAGQVHVLGNSVSELESKLNHLRSDLKQLTERVNGFDSRIDGMQSDVEQQQGSNSAIFATVTGDIARLQEGNKNVVESSTYEGDLDVIRSDIEAHRIQLSSDVNAIRIDMQNLQDVEGGSKLVGDVSKLQAVLDSVRTQLQGLEPSNAGGVEPTVAVDLAELRSDIEKITGDVRRHQASISTLNSTVVVLQGDQQVQAASIQQNLNDLRKELDAILLRLDELTSVKANQKELDELKLKASTVQSHVDNIKFDIESLQFQLGKLSAKSADLKEFDALTERVSSLQAAVFGLQEQLATESGDVNIVQLVSRVNSIGDLMEKYKEDGIFAGGNAGGNRGQDQVENEQLQGSLGSVQDELARIKQDLATLNGIMFIANKDGETHNVLQDIAAQLASVEANLDGLKSSQLDVKDAVNTKIGALTQLMSSLRDQLNKLQNDVSDTFGAAAGASVRDDLVDVKANLSDLNEQQIKLLAQIKDCCNKSQLADIFEAGGISGASINWTDTEGLDEDRVRNIVLSALTLYNADKTGMVDYALESAGGSVVSTRCSETFSPRTALLTVMGIPLWYDSKSPRAVIQPDMQPGNCWAFKGSEGYLVIQLSSVITPTAFSMEHIPKSLSPSGMLESAPREFSVWSVANEYDSESFLLGRYEYTQDGNPLQFFPVTELNVVPTGMVELKIHSNHGHMEYTCLYRFRVHGTLQP